MATRAQKVRLSIFLIASSTLLLTFFIILIGNRLLKRMDWYYIEYKDISVTGLEPGAAVKYHGVQVGRVAALSVKDVATIQVQIEVEKGTPIKENTEATLTIVGITGLKFVELSGGSEDAPDLPIGGTIVAGESVFETISGRAEIILAKLEQVLNNLNVMLNEETTVALRNALQSVNDVAEEVDGLIKDNREHLAFSAAKLDTLMISFASTADNIDRTTATLNDLVQSGKIDSVVTNIAFITRRIRTQLDSLRLAETMADIRTLVNNSNQMVTHTDLIVVRARDDILQSMRSLEEALDNLREATDVIRDNPSVLIRGRQTSGDRIE